MTEQLQKEIAIQIQTLPKELQKVITSFEWGNISEKIVKKYFFTEDEINSIQAEIALVVLGLESIDNLAYNIENNASTTKSEAEKITNDSIREIFDPMGKKLNEIIPKSLDNKNIHWQQNVDFILSGGDYTAFIQRVEEPKNIAPTVSTNTINASRFDDLKSKFTI